jgi:hydrogenase maturation protease
MVKDFNGIAVIGIGNTLMSDEGVGVHIVNTLIENYHFSPEIMLIDGGTAGMELLQFFQDNEKIIIVDAVNFDQQPGFIGSIENDDILTRLNNKLSLHHLGITDVLASLKLTGGKANEIFLLGIQPESIEVGLELTTVIAEKKDKMCRIILQKLEDWGVIIRKKERNIKITSE